MKLALAVVLAATGTATAAPRDFTSDVSTTYAVAACGDAPPATFDASAVTAHCRELAKATKQWKTNWYDKASPWLAAHVGAASGGKVPTTVVYPFGGGDVVTMLAVYPNASEYTSLSLEGIGDPRPIATLDRGKLISNLGKLRTMLAANLNWAWNTTIQLSDYSSETGTAIPGILTFALVALDVHGYEPVEARYFRIAADGTLDYVTQEQVDQWDADQKAARAKRKPTNSVQAGLFNNIEITFRKKGDKTAPKKVFRHVAADLSDNALADNPAVLKYLDKRSDFAVMTKAASYLLWKPAQTTAKTTGFEKIRSALLARMKIMVSDDTGIPPRYAKPAGFTQEVHGVYQGAFFAWARGEVEKEMIELWKPSTDKLPFRFGYYDNKRQPHLLITKK